MDASYDFSFRISTPSTLEIGRVTEIPVADLPTTKIDDFSLHQIPTSNLLRELQEACGIKVTVLVCDVGAVPQEIAPGLSSAVCQAVASAAERLAERLGLAARYVRHNRSA